MTRLYAIIKSKKKQEDVMCNIAGYVGERRAAPILLEMLKRQQHFDGGISAGIATLHEGRIYMRKVVGDVDTLIKTTDALNLPGNIGIAHTRPGGTPETWAFAHPFLTDDGSMAAMTNGTAGTFPRYREYIQGVTDRLCAEGYEFRDRAYLEESTFPHLADGSFVSCVSVRMNMVHRNIKEGMNITAAMAKMASDVYVDNVFGVLHRDTPDRFYILRTTRPAVALTTEHGTCIASTRFAFDDELAKRAVDLPVMSPCIIKKDGFEVSDEKMSNCAPVGEITPKGFEDFYERLCGLLRGKCDAPLDFDALEIFARNNLRGCFTGDAPLFEYARAVYDVLYRLKNEGSLKFKTGQSNKKVRYLMWID